MTVVMTIGLAGNPNSGKTTIFNSLTGGRQHVGNYAGVTVEKKEGKCKYEERELNIVDLPGTYSLTAYSIEELVTRNFVIEGKPDVVVDVIDASNLERNLYLATQFIELEVPLILAFNMIDEAKGRGDHIDKELLSKLLGCPIVYTVARKGEGVQDILKAAVNLSENNREAQKIIINYGKEIENQIERLSVYCDKHNILQKKYSTRWLCVKLLENDTEIINELRQKCKNAEDLLSINSQCRNYLKNFFGEEPEIIIIDRRYGFVNGACKEAVHLNQEERITSSENIDKVLTNRILGIPIFILFMWIIFQLTFFLGNPPMKCIEFGFAVLGKFISSILHDGMVKSLIVNGIIGGVGGVLVFIPNILLLFLAIAILEDTGYMARVAFIVDKLMHRIGLHGKAFIPMLIGFGCNVPAIMATRILENKRDRLTTILVLPLMSCGARLPIYTLLIATFFSPEISGTILFSLYMMGIILAILMAKLFRKFLFTGASSPFVMELPPYRIPTLKSVLLHMWEHTWLYLQKAGTILLALSIMVWFLTNFPQNTGQNPVERIAASYAGHIGKTLEPFIAPLGFDWKIGIALFSGLSAKEVVVSTLGTLYREETTNHPIALREAIRKDKTFSPLVAYTLMVFVLIYIPCFATVTVVWRETNSIVWPAFMIFYTTSLAWMMSFIIYQGGRLLGLG